MERKNMWIGLRVCPSGKGFTKNWNLSGSVGTITRMGKNFITVKWDDGIEQAIFRPMHLEPTEEMRLVFPWIKPPKRK